MATSEGISLELWRNIQLVCPTNTDLLFRDASVMSTSQLPVSESSPATVLTEQECSSLWEEARRSNSVDTLGQCFSLGCQELLNQLEQDTLLDRGKTAILNFLCQYGIIKMKFGLSNSTTHSIGHCHSDLQSRAHVIGHSQYDIMHNQQSTEHPIGHPHGDEVNNLSQLKGHNRKVKIRKTQTRIRRNVDIEGRRNRRTILPPRNVNRQYQDIEIEDTVQEDETSLENLSPSQVSYSVQFDSRDRQEHSGDEQGSDSATNVLNRESFTDENFAAVNQHATFDIDETDRHADVIRTDHDDTQKSTSKNTSKDEEIVTQQSETVRTTIHWRDGDMDSEGNIVCVNNSDVTKVKGQSTIHKVGGQSDILKVRGQKEINQSENTEEKCSPKITIEQNEQETESEMDTQTPGDEITETDRNPLQQRRKSIHENIEWLNKRSNRGSESLSVPMATDNNDEGETNLDLNDDIGHVSNTEQCQIKAEIAKKNIACEIEARKLTERVNTENSNSDIEKTRGGDSDHSEIDNEHSQENNSDLSIKVKVEHDGDLEECGSPEDNASSSSRTQYWAVEHQQIIESNDGDTDVLSHDSLQHHNIFSNADIEGLSSPAKDMSNKFPIMGQSCVQNFPLAATSRVQKFPIRTPSNVQKFPIRAPSTLPKFPIAGPSSMQNFLSESPSSVPFSNRTPPSLQKFPLAAPLSVQKFPIMAHSSLQKYPAVAHTSLQNTSHVGHSSGQQFSTMSPLRTQRFPCAKSPKELSPEEKKQIAAEKMRRYRAKLRLNEEKWRAYRARDTERKRILRRNKKLSAISEQEYREKARVQQQRYRERMQRIRQSNQQSALMMNQSDMFSNHNFFSNTDEMF